MWPAINQRNFASPTDPPERELTGKDFNDSGGTALRALRLRCLDCSGASRNEVDNCQFGPDHPTNPCDLHTFRFGKNPNYN
jgi:hypothetical protein